MASDKRTPKHTELAEIRRAANLPAKKTSSSLPTGLGSRPDWKEHDCGSLDGKEVAVVAYGGTFGKYALCKLLEIHLLGFQENYAWGDFSPEALLQNCSIDEAEGGCCPLLTLRTAEADDWRSCEPRQQGGGGPRSCRSERALETPPRAFPASPGAPGSNPFLRCRQSVKPNLTPAGQGKTI